MRGTGQRSVPESVARFAVRAFILILLAGLTATTGAGRSVLDPPGSAYGVVGPRGERGYFSQLPFEAVDTVTGNLTLSFTDLVLPGNAGMDLNITRTYSHQSSGSKWTFGFNGVPVAVDMPVAPASPAVWTPSLIMGDGSAQSLHTGVVSGYWVTTEFWRYESTSRTLYLPNGWVATYNTGTPYNGRIYLVEVHDAYGNTITPSWTSSTWLLDSVTQTVDDGGATHTRTVDFSYSSGSQPTSMSYDSRVWDYTYETSSPYRMTHAAPPVGPDWDFTYGSNTLTVTSPSGGTAEYDFQDEDGRSVVSEITTGGRAITSGTWAFDYSVGVTTITTPSSRDLVYSHAWHDGPDGKQWTLSEQSVVVGSTEVFSVARTYADIGFLSSRPLKVLDVQTITQDGVTFTTDLHYSSSNFGDYLQPDSITESASNHSTTRVTTRTFHYFTTGYILPKVSGETVTVGSGAFSSSVAYDSTGFVESQISLGKTSTFTRDSFGNPKSRSDPDTHTTEGDFQWGVQRTVTTPEYQITRSINVDGSVASETRDGKTTSFGYDALGRTTGVTPATGDASATTYASDASYVTVTRGSSWVKTTVDGFGRPIATETVGGVKTTTTFDAEGFKTFQSAPFTGSSGTGNTFEYDALGRIKKVVHADSSDVEYAYSGTSVTVTDENNHATTQTRQAFGTPGGGRLTSVVDANSNTWAYSYNALDRLTLVDPPAGPNRSWTYNGTTNLLESDTQPESGTTTYTYYASGLLETRTDAENLETTYVYDANHRLTGILAPVASENVTFEYDDSDNLTRMITGALESLFTYDNANRLDSREDRINGRVFITDYDYDTRDNLKKITYPSGRIVQYDYDSSNRITKVYGATTATLYAEDLAYHPTGALSAAEFGNGTTESLTLNSRFRPNRLISGPLDATYGYDAAGNVTSIDDARSGYDSDFAYDALDRLTGVTGYGATAFTYDAQGNRLTKGSGTPQVGYTYSSTTNRLTSATTTLGAPEAGTFSYDDVGNMEGDGTGTYTYSSRNMMKASTISGAITKYQYDAAGQRAMKSGPSGQTLFIHGLGGLLLAEYATSFSKESPLPPATGLSPDVTFEWGAVSSATYEFCVDATNNDACDGSWTSMSSARTTNLSDLGAGTYFWQVRATTGGGTTYADAGKWWSFTVNTEGAFGKFGPRNLSVVLVDDVTLSWPGLPDVGWSVCWDTSDNDSCDGSWWPNGAATSRVLEDLSPGTYFWQIRAWDGSTTTEADAGVWWSFTVTTGATGKLTPANGTSDLGASVPLSWSAIEDTAYYVCVDTVNDDACGTEWWANGGSTTRLLEGLSAGTYYWQVLMLTPGGWVYANGGTWFRLTVGAGSASGLGTASVAREYVYLGSRLLASIETGTTTTYYHTDTLGSVRAITNSSGSTVTRHDFFPFGESTSSLSGDPRRFLGEQLDAETAFSHLGARYYRNVWGRFTSVDPIFSEAAPTNPQLWNRYSYALNGPLRYSDPNGLAPQENEPMMESDESISGFSLAAFNAWAEGLYLTNMILAHQAKLSPTDALLNALPLGTAQAVRRAIAEMIAPIIFGAFGMPMALPGGYRETGFTMYSTPTGPQAAHWDPGHFQLPRPGGQYIYNAVHQLPSGCGDPGVVCTPTVIAHAHPSGTYRGYPYTQRQHAEDEAAASRYPNATHMVISNTGTGNIYFYNSRGSIGSPVPLSLFFQRAR